MDPFRRLDRTWTLGRVVITVLALPVGSAVLMSATNPDESAQLLIAGLGVIAGIVATAWLGGKFDMWCVGRARRIARTQGTRVPDRWDG